MNKIVFNDGTEIENGLISIVSWAKGKIFVVIPGNDLIRAVELLGDPEKSKKMECYNSIYKDTYYGHTVVESIGPNAGRTSIEAWVSGNDDAHHEREYTVPEMFTPEAITKRYHDLDDKEKNQNGPENESEIISSGEN